MQTARKLADSRGAASQSGKREPESGNKSCTISPARGSGCWNPLVLRQTEGSEGRSRALAAGCGDVDVGVCF